MCSRQGRTAGQRQWWVDERIPVCVQARSATHPKSSHRRMPTRQAGCRPRTVQARAYKAGYLHGRLFARQADRQAGYAQRVVVRVAFDIPHRPRHRPGQAHGRVSLGGRHQPRLTQSNALNVGNVWISHTHAPCGIHSPLAASTRPSQARRRKGECLIKSKMEDNGALQ